ncbi:hypothetical protein SG34_029960 [Thalassomonas viridans]|uniref:Uncharacterized protein n=1 Tax=Thalassomonas viridans TaxID=137584 RepID=A0AAE9ZE84_9GAMM|nr:hypothetical protein [Thalassomonas viridans]WDE05504.1 hypothetical protein SG34_000710 [Thalassomonas viridans]WDE09008.1 hypothetical protein SG34_029960 [Thalassomonas viridans]
MQMSVKPYHIRFIKNGVAAPIIPDSPKGERLLKVEPLPCVNGHLPKLTMFNKNSYVMVCQKSGCNCPANTGNKPQNSYAKAVLEWNKFTSIYSTADLYHPTVRVKDLPLKEVRLNLTVEGMFINKFLASFSRDDLDPDDREIFVIREKWLEVLKYQLCLLEAGENTALPTHKHRHKHRHNPVAGQAFGKVLA